MKKALKVILILLVVLLIAAVSLGLWQKDNLTALHSSMTMEPAAIQQVLDEKREEFDAVMDEYQIPKKEFTQDEINKLVSGEQSPENMADTILKEESREDCPEPAKDTSLETAIQKEIATMYVLEATYEGKLAAIAESAIDEYIASDGQDKESIVFSKLDQLSALEKECDRQVAEVTARLRDLLPQAGKDTSLADQIEEAYQTEKSMKKAYYVQKFQQN